MSYLNSGYSDNKGDIYYRNSFNNQYNQYNDEDTDNDEYSNHDEYTNNDTVNDTGIKELPADLEKFRTKIARKLEDIDRADAIISAYKNNLLPLIPASKRHAFEKWLAEKIGFFGSESYNHELLYSEKDFCNRSFIKTAKFQKAYDAFVAQVLNTTFIENPLPCVETANKIKKNITVLYPGSMGGGHKAPATAIGKRLEELGHTVKVIDVNELEDVYDPRVEGLTNGQIYTEVFQKNGDKKRANKLWNKRNEMIKPSQRRYLQDLRKMIVDFKTDQIISVAHHYPKLSTLSFQLGIPMTYVHTDHVFHGKLVPLAIEQQALEKKLLNFTSLSNDANFFKKLNKALEQPIGTQLPQKLEEQIVRLDFPIRDAFQPASQDEIDTIRSDLRIPQDAIVCKLAMGANGIAKDIKKCIEKFVAEKDNFAKPVHLVVVCGNNKDLKTELDAALPNYKLEGSMLNLDIRGFMQEKEMAQYDKVSDVWLTKPGGSTTSELVQMRKQMLYVASKDHPWELNNARYAETLGLAKEYSEDKTLSEQLQERMQAASTLDVTKLAPSKWKEQIAKIVAERTKEEQFVLAMQRRFKTGLSDDLLLQLSTYIEKELPKQITEGSVYIQRKQSNLPCAIEYDAITKKTFIHLKDHTVSKLGEGKAKKVSYSIVYDPVKPEVVASLMLKDFPDNAEKEQRLQEEFKRECDLLEKIKDAQYLANAIAITEHTKIKTGKVKQQILQSIYSKGDLRSYMKKEKLDKKTKIRMSLMMLKGMSELHKFGYVHRDTHLGNFIVDEKQGVRLTDYGYSSKKEEASGIVAQAAMQHRAPEALFPENLKATDYEKTDLFSLGCCLYEFYHGKAPKWMAKDKHFKFDKPSERQKKEAVATLKEAIHNATDSRRNELEEKAKRRELDSNETFEYAVLQMLHPEVNERKDAAHWVAVLETSLNQA